MLTTLTIRQAKEAVDNCSVYETMFGGYDNDAILYRNIRIYGQFQYACKLSSTEGPDLLFDEIRQEELNLYHSEKVFAIISPSRPFTMLEIEEKRTGIDGKLSQLFPGVLVCWQYFDFLPEEEMPEGMDVMTLIFYQDGEPWPRFSKIRQDYQMILDNEEKEAKYLQKEFDRYEKVQLISAIKQEDISRIMDGHHLLWHGSAASNGTADAMVDKLRPGIEHLTSVYDVSGMFLFIDADSQFTTMSEVSDLQKGFRALLGKNAVVATSIVTEPSYVKAMSCRVYLVGNPKYIKGHVYMDFGRYEILLYESDDRNRGHIIVASYEDEQLTVARYDWGAYDHNRDGQTDDHHYFDKENTAKLCEALQVKHPETLLRKLKERFARHMAIMADEKIKDFCDRRDIKYHSEYYY